MSFFKKYEVNPNGVISFLISVVACYCIHSLFAGFIVKIPIEDYVYLFLASTLMVFLIFLYQKQGFKEIYTSYIMGLLLLLTAVGMNELANFYYANIFKLSYNGNLIWLFISALVFVQYFIISLFFKTIKIVKLLISVLFVIVAVLIAEPSVLNAIGIAFAAGSFLFFIAGAIVLLSTIFKSRG